MESACHCEQLSRLWADKGCRLKTSICIDSVYSEIPFDDRIKQAVLDGFDYVEFWNSEGRDPHRIKTLLANAGIGLLSFNGDDKVSIIEPDNEQAYLAYLESQMKFAVSCGSKGLAVHSNALDSKGNVINDYSEVPFTAKLLNMYGTLEKAVQLAEKYEINLCLEPLNVHVEHVGNFLQSTEMAAEIVMKINSPRLKVLYDSYHMHLNGEDMESTLTNYADQIGHIHIADSDGRGEPGTGRIDYQKLFRLLDKVGYNKTIGFELFPKRKSSLAISAIKKLLSENNLI